MLVRAETGSRTVILSLGAENLPLLDDFADLVICRNALDHMPDPAVAVKEIWRVLNQDGALFVSVDMEESRRLTDRPCSPSRASGHSCGNISTW